MKRNRILTENYIIGLLLAAVGSWIFGKGVMILICIVRKRIEEISLMLDIGYNIVDAVICAFGEIIALFIIIAGISVLYIAAKKAEISIVRKTQKKKKKKIIICAKCFRYHKKNR